ncbi:MAG: hypothetical protein GX846_02600, partial [Deltaproteobacteria bacterium]|nr:hypothetical protein [Deltaproteobacteria bacterium]
MEKREIVVLMGTCGKSAGSDRVYEKFASALKAKSIAGVELKQSGCTGICYSEVNVKTSRDGKEFIYAWITEDDVEKLINSEIIEKKTYAEKLLLESDLGDDTTLFPKQKRIVLRNCGRISPTSIDEYIAKGGYKAIEKALQMPPEKVVQEIKDSGLRGRGGAGFPTGLKWELTRKNPAPEGRYFICNADEGDPGAFMDRSVLEGDPHTVIEGKRGMPNLRPPYPAEKGLFGKSTVINNVETLANIPWIISN